MELVKTTKQIHLKIDENTYQTLHSNGVNINDTCEGYVMGDDGNLVLKILTPEDTDKRQW